MKTLQLEDEKISRTRSTVSTQSELWQIVRTLKRFRENLRPCPPLLPAVMLWEQTELLTSWLEFYTTGKIDTLLRKKLRQFSTKLNQKNLFRSSSSEQKASREVRMRASRALNNMVHAHPADKQCKREAKVLKLLETLRLYTDLLRDINSAINSGALKVTDSKLIRHGCYPIGIQLPSQSAIMTEFPVIIHGIFSTAWFKK